jgi:hypothetical protein
MGNSKILDGADNVIGKAGGCGYDRYGAALGTAIAELFTPELLKLARRECKELKPNRTRKGSKDYYGLFYNAKDKTAYVDGGCGSDCMVKILNKIGFTLQWVGETGGHGQSGVVFYTLQPLSAHDRKYHR